ncbi:MAG: DUF3892 domain-containing protein [Capsulimonas sp.]|uniref:DUF3892 domain-containing protein n=1 Tax=Capsulimonas sp. TaxID=2494211 RepID=UPI003267175F
MSDLKITLIRFFGGDSHEHISHFEYAVPAGFGVNERGGVKSREQLVEDILNGSHTAYVLKGLFKIPLVGIEDHNPQYVRTVPDDSQEDNLLNLPVFRHVAYKAYLVKLLLLQTLDLEAITIQAGMDIPVEER